MLKGHHSMEFIIYGKIHYGHIFYFSVHISLIQRQNTKYVGVIDGIAILYINNETTASSSAYGLNEKIQDGIFKVKTTASDTHVSGEEFNNQLILYNRFLEDESHPTSPLGVP